MGPDVAVSLRSAPTVSAAGAAWLLVLAALAGPGVGSAGAQVGLASERCDLLENAYVRSIMAGEGHRIVYISGPVVFGCRDGTRIRADSVVQYTRDDVRQLFGDVRIDGPESTLRADRVDEFGAVGRIRAWNDVVVFDSAQGTRIVGDTLSLLRGEGAGDDDRMTVWGEDPSAVVRLRESAAVEGADSALAPGLEAADDTTRAPDSLRVSGEEEELPERAGSASAAPPSPDTVFADRLHLEGRRAFRAGGAVRILREGFHAFSDSLEYLRGGGEMTLLGAPRIEGDAFELTGRTIQLVLGEEGVRFVRSRGDARLTGEELLLTAPEVRVFLSDGEMDRLVAVRGEEGAEAGEAPDEPASEDPGVPGDSVAAPPRPVARAEEFVLRADSIEALAPGRALERVFAAGRARGESLGRDSLNTDATPEIARRDWIEGDSVVAFFVSADTTVPAPAGTPARGEEGRARSRLDRLVARGNARSLYRLVQRGGTGAEGDTVGTGAVEAEGAAEGERRDTAAAAPGAGALPDSLAVGPGAPEADAGGTPGRRIALHYVTGREITIVLWRGQVEHMEVVGQTQGLYLEPGSPGAEIGTFAPGASAPGGPPGDGVP